ncbi:hypothetical protein JW960_18515 [candidate division KSB1 bacterium]|nr:hypothetical protein [candidate division KSB1 bacterium]
MKISMMKRMMMVMFAIAFVICAHQTTFARPDNNVQKAEKSFNDYATDIWIWLVRVPSQKFVKEKTAPIQRFDAPAPVPVEWTGKQPKKPHVDRYPAPKPQPVHRLPLTAPVK